MHHAKWLAYGDPSGQPDSRLLRCHWCGAWRLYTRSCNTCSGGTGTCEIDGCERPTQSASIPLCKAHYEARRKHGDLPTCKTPGCGGIAVVWGDCIDHAMPTYRTVHWQLVQVYGSAADRECVDCGKQAAHWAFDNRDQPDTLISPEGYRYSANLTRYSPKCALCHSAERYSDLCLRGHQTRFGPGRKRECPTCRREFAENVKAAARLLGLSGAEYQRRYGHTQAVALRVLAGELVPAQGEAS